MHDATIISMDFDTIFQFFDVHRSLYTISLVLALLIIGLVLTCYFVALSKLDQNKKSYEEISKRIEENKKANSGEKRNIRFYTKEIHCKSY